MFTIAQVFSIGGIIAAVVGLLFPGASAFLYRAPLGFLIGYVVAAQQAREGADRRDALALAAVTGPAGALVFLLFGVSHSLLTAILALVGMWIAVQVAAERFLHVDIEKAYGITGVICATTWLIWMLIAALITVLRALAK